MGFLNSLNIAGSALTAERFRMEIVAQNLAHINTTRTSSGTPYQRQQLVFAQQEMTFENVLSNQARATGGGVKVAAIVKSDAPFVPVYNPSHPDANEDGYVMMPNVNRAEEQLDFMAASRAYEANLSALSVLKTMSMKALEIGK